MSRHPAQLGYPLPVEWVLRYRASKPSLSSETPPNKRFQPTAFGAGICGASCHQSLWLLERVLPESAADSPPRALRALLNCGPLLQASYGWEKSHRTNGQLVLGLIPCIIIRNRLKRLPLCGALELTR